MSNSVNVVLRFIQRVDPETMKPYTDGFYEVLGYDDYSSASEYLASSDTLDADRLAMIREIFTLKGAVSWLMDNEPEFSDLVSYARERGMYVSDEYFDGSEVKAAMEEVRKNEEADIDANEQDVSGVLS